MARRPGHAATGRGLRSHVVAWLRVLLPLAALALLATLFLWQNRPDIESAIPFAEAEGDALTGPPRITEPQWAGVTEDGAEVTLRADTAIPRGGDDARAEALRLDWLGPGGTRAEATAPAATMGTDAITLSGGVRVRLSSGWTLDAAMVSASRSRSEITATGDVAITAPFGTLTADAARLHRRAMPGDAGTGAETGEVLDFTGDVRLLYQP